MSREGRARLPREELEGRYRRRKEFYGYGLSQFSASGCNSACLIIPRTTLRSFVFAVLARSRIIPVYSLLSVSRTELSSSSPRRKKSFARALVSIKRTLQCYGWYVE